jgi:putative oxidoreductase
MTFGHALFPGGIAGAGLLLLRLSVAGSLLLLTASCCDGANLCRFLAFLGAAGLFTGFETRILAALSLAVVIFVPGPHQQSIAAVHVIDAVALALTGPGRWSADAILFGRRDVILPDRSGTAI